VIYHVLTTFVVCVHFTFLAFVVVGGVVARRYRWIALPHLLAAAWGIYVEAMPGLRCPLTALENTFALRAGAEGYSTTFLDHYLLPIIYPEGLTPVVQEGLAVALVVWTVLVYIWPRPVMTAHTPPNKSAWSRRGE